MAPFGAFPLAYSRRGLSPPNGQSSATGHSTVDQSQVWGGTPANTSICRNSSLWTGKRWIFLCFFAMLLVALYGILAFVMWGILSVDLPRLMVWNRTGDERRRKFAGKVLKVRNRPDWLLLSLLILSVAIAEVLPILWSHLFMTGGVASFVMTNIVIFVSQVGPTFVMPVFHLEISGKFTWLVRLIMWLSAPVIVVPAYAMRRFRKWRRRGQQAHMDGLLPLDELIEYIHLHEKGQGYGGTLDNHVGKAMRELMDEQISSEASGRHVETEESTAIGAESAVGSIGIRSHRQEGSTAVEDVPAPGLRKRGDRSAEGRDLFVPVMQIPQQALIKDLIHGPVTPIDDKYVGQGALNVKALQRDFPLQTLSASVTPCKYRLPMLESYWNEQNNRGLGTDSSLMEQR